MIFVLGLLKTCKEVLENIDFDCPQIIFDMYLLYPPLQNSISLIWIHMNLRALY